MQRPVLGPLWPPSDDPVENSLRRAYLRAPPRPPVDTNTPDQFRDLLDHLTEALKRPAQMRQNA